MTSQAIFSNFTQTTLSSPSGPSDTSIVVATGTGALFPNPTGDDFFVGFFVDSATKTLREVFKCTARSGDTLTVVRAQEGTTALSWGVGDYVVVGATAGQMALFFQLDAANTVTGTADFTGGSIAVPNKTLGDNTTAAANTAFVIANANDIATTTVNAALGSGAIIASTYTSSTSTVTVNDAIPSDGTVPEVTEGDAIISVSHAAKSSSNAVRIVFNASCVSYANQPVIVAFFRGSTCIDASSFTVASGDSVSISMVCAPSVAGSTSSQTYSVRMGATLFGVNDATSTLGSAQKITMFAEELKA